MRLLAALAVPAVLVVLVLTFLVVVFGGIDSAVASDFDRQCEVAIPNPSATVTATVTVAASPVAAPVSPSLTANPYAELTFAADDTSVTDRQRACASAMRTAVYQQRPPLNTRATGAAARCAGETIAALVNRNSGGAAGGAQVEPAAITAAVLHRISAATATGYCQPLTDAEAQSLSAARSGRNPDRCPLPGSGEVLVLPDSIAAQSLCGEQVATGAESPGDLVFWDYRANAPTRVGLAVEAGQSTGGSMVVVSWDPNSGRLLELAMPSGSGVRVKRVLGDAT
ncbi:hypothetical protein [Nocardia sp. NPDC056000]|uniref:hypothetical protein n=1 Tax=Nocardia sp. NPDC056000 TaxID=3345674 RepID=UPI0035E2B951